MNRATLVAATAAAVALTAGCTGSGAPTPLPSTTSAVSPAATSSPTGMYGRELRQIASDPSAAFTCRELTASERDATRIRYKVAAPSPAAAVPVAEGWSVVAWLNKGERMAFLSNGKPYDWGTSYQAIPVDGSWRGTHTNMGIALEDGPRALSAALQCLDA